MAEFYSAFGKCPSCGKRFGIRLAGKKLIKEQTFERKVREVQGVTVGGPFTRTSAGDPGQGQAVIAMERPEVVAVREFQYAYQCKHCGHEWAAVRKVEGRPAGPKN